VSREESIFLTVAIPTRNRARDVIETLSAVAPQLAHGDELVVVDDGSDNGSAFIVSDWINRHLPLARFVATPFGGLSAARNAALATARNRAVCFIDDDATPCEGWIATLRDAWSTASSDIAVIGGPIRPGWETRPPWLQDELLYVVSVLDHGPPFRELAKGEHAWGANISVLRSGVLEVGGFDPAWGPGPGRGGRGEEDELQTRITDAGYRILWAPGAAVVHRLSPERLTVEAFRSFMANQAVRVREAGGLTRRRASCHATRTGARYALARARRDSVDATIASIYFAGWFSAAFSRRRAQANRD
jgi:glycosyltransferase involved in cell wall biosynthesis